MKTKQSKFDLLDLMMGRLGVSPGLLTMEWLRNDAVSFVCVPQENSQKSTRIGITGKIVSAKLLVKGKEETSPKANTPEMPQTSGSKKSGGKKPAPKESLFYSPDWAEAGDKFELNKNTISQLRCGMYVYRHGSKIEITQKPLSSQKVKNQNYTFIGIAFDVHEDVLMTLCLCAFKSCYAKVLKRLDFRLPSGEECEKIFVYKDLLHKGFDRLNINFKATQKIFYDGNNGVTGKVCMFDFQEGKTVLQSVDSALADAYQVQTMKF